MANSQINSSYLSMPLDEYKYKEIDGTVSSNEILKLVKDSVEGLISTGKDDNGKFPFQAIIQKQ